MPAHETKKHPMPPQDDEKVRKAEDERGIPGYGQPPSEVRTTHPEDAPVNDWEPPAGR
jgi:hypothetical protein